jgi:redox-regulated HSP33 family molecular chaperone
MKSKIIDGNKVYVLELLRRKGLKELYRGVVPLYYGMMISAFAYYYLYSWMRERLRNKYQADNQDLKKTLMIASAASFVAEGVAFTIYYPLDLIKTRM